LARIVHVEPDPAGDWLAGCAFISELTDDELAQFKAQRLPPVGPDDRRWVRFPCNVETVCSTWETTPGEQVRARVLNVSPGGIGLLLPCQFERGTLLNFELPTVQGQPPKQMLVRVVRAMEHTRGDWFLGCELVQPLTAAELAELLA
jgi:hypothetical protein